MSDSPCIGVCSTTYGDFVCRGCKRFAHEVVGWNRFSDAQREIVWERLSELLMKSIQDHLIVDASRRGTGRGESAHDLMAELKAEMSRNASQSLTACLERLGVAMQVVDSSIDNLPALVHAIENAFLTRSEAYYEHSYSTSLALALLRPSGDAQ